MIQEGIILQAGYGYKQHQRDKGQDDQQLYKGKPLGRGYTGCAKDVTSGLSLQSKQLQPDYVSSYNYSISQLLMSWFLPSPP